MDLEGLQPNFLSGEKSVIQNNLESFIYTVYNIHWLVVIDYMQAKPYLEVLTQKPLSTSQEITLTKNWI